MKAMVKVDFSKTIWSVTGSRNTKQESGGGKSNTATQHSVSTFSNKLNPVNEALACVQCLFMWSYNHKKISYIVSDVCHPLSFGLFCGVVLMTVA